MVPLFDRGPTLGSRPLRCNLDNRRVPHPRWRPPFRLRIVHNLHNQFILLDQVSPPGKRNLPSRLVPLNQLNQPGPSTSRHPRSGSSELLSRGPSSPRQPVLGSPP